MGKVRKGLSQRQGKHAEGGAEEEKNNKKRKFAKKLIRSAQWGNKIPQCNKKKRDKGK